MALEFIPFDEFNVRAHIKKKILSQRTWAAKEKRNQIDKIFKHFLPPKGLASSRPDIASNGTINIEPPPWDGALHRRPGADQNF